jgi:hypothetical protein
LDRSHISRLDPRPNANTRVNTGMAAAEPRIDVGDLDEAYARARAIEAPPLHDGVRLVWVKGRHIGHHDLAASADAFAVVGRHTACDVVLSADPALALRHLLVRAVRLEDGAIATRVLDLKTSLGFHLDDDEPRRALVATGPVAMRVGRYALVALPTGPLPAQRPAPEIMDAPRIPLGRPAGSITRVTTIPPAPMLDDIARDAAAAGLARVTLRRPDGEEWAQVDLTEAQLDLGVLVGRADRCEPRLRAVLTDAVSRTHVLLLRENGVVHAFDVASTQGTFAEDRRVRRVRLPERGGTLRLAASAPVMLDWHPRED